MNYCSECGKKIDIEAKFCSNCGSKINFNKSTSPNVEDSSKIYNSKTDSTYITKTYEKGDVTERRLQTLLLKGYFAVRDIVDKYKIIILNEGRIEYFNEKRMQYLSIRLIDSHVKLNKSSTSFKNFSIVTSNNDDLNINLYTSEKIFDQLLSNLDSEINKDKPVWNPQVNSIQNFKTETVKTTSSNEIDRSARNNDQSVSVPFLHYVLIPINIIFPWSIVSWIGIPLSLYAKNQLNKLSETKRNENKNHLLWTNISLGIFIFYLFASIIRQFVI